MTDGAALLAAILASPKEDTPRLMYADWLEENGRPERAEFIRVQIELAQMDRAEYVRVNSPYPLIKENLRRRERELLELIGHEILGLSWGSVVNKSPTIVFTDGWENVGNTFRRGFMAEIECPWERWRTHAAAILAAHPIEKVRLTTRPECEYSGTPGPSDETYYWVCLNLGDRLSKWANQIAKPGEKPPVIQLLEAEWPGIEFELPPERQRLEFEAGYNFIVQDRRRSQFGMITSPPT